MRFLGRSGTLDAAQAVDLARELDVARARDDGEDVDRALDVRCGGAGLAELELREAAVAECPRDANVALPVEAREHGDFLVVQSGIPLREAERAIQRNSARKKRRFERITAPGA